MANIETISFDCMGQGYEEEEWDQICHEISLAMEHKGLPALYSDKWKETDGSCVFQGTSEEVAQIHSILSKFPVTIT